MASADAVASATGALTSSDLDARGLSGDNIRDTFNDLGRPGTKLVAGTRNESRRTNLMIAKIEMCRNAVERLASAHGMDTLRLDANEYEVSKLSDGTLIGVLSLYHDEVKSQVTFLPENGYRPFKDVLVADIPTQEMIDESVEVVLHDAAVLYDLETHD